VLPECNRELAALVLCWTLHISRVQELLDRTTDDLNPNTGALTVGHMKTGQPRTILLSEPVLAAIFSYDWQNMRWLFRYNNHSNVYRDLKKACARAGVKYYSPYKFGRHNATRRLLDAGKSLKFVQAAGRWKTIKIPAERYGQLEHNDVDVQVNEFADEWAKKRGLKPKKSRLESTANTRQKR
jgi:integrase